MIDPSFWSDEKLGECTIQERFLFMGLVSNADDEGYGRANPKLLRSSIFPYDDLRASDLEKWLSRLGGLKLVVLYTVDGQAYYYLPNFSKHQTINKPTKSAFPKPLPEDYGSTTVGLPEDYLLREEKGKEEEEKGKEELLPGAPLEPPCQSQAPVITLTLNDKTEYPVTTQQYQEWAALYPAVDIMQQLRSMRGWINANPAKRKTKSGIGRFINGWLAKEQNKGGGISANGGSSFEPGGTPPVRRQIGKKI